MGEARKRVRVVTPEDLSVTADLLRSPFVTQPPVQVALQLSQQAWPWTWGITGSTGYALATGIPVIHADSDLDLLIRAPQPISLMLLPHGSRSSAAHCAGRIRRLIRRRAVCAGGVAARRQNAAENLPWTAPGGGSVAQGGVMKILFTFPGRARSMKGCCKTCRERTGSGP
jgi:hypothetical protein